MLKIIPVFFVAWLTLGFCASAQAQWQWVDESGRKIFSDNPPPKNIPDDRILRDAKGKPYRPVYGDRRARTGQSISKPLANPAAAPIKTASSAVIAPAGAASAIADKSGKGTLDAAVVKKKQAEKAQEEAKRKTEEAAQKKIRADQCARLQDNLRTINSGSRISQVGRNGEQSFMDEPTRITEGKRIQSEISKSCK